MKADRMGALGLPAGRLHRRRHVEVPQDGLALGWRHRAALDPGANLGVERHALPDPAGRRLPVARPQPQLGGEADRAVGRHGHPERRMRPLVGLRRHAQLQHPIAALPRGIGRVVRVRESGVRGRKRVVGPGVREALLGPGLPHDLDRLAKQLAILLVLPRVGVRVELRPLVGPHAAAEADVDPPPGEVVQEARSSASRIGCHQGRCWPSARSGFGGSGRPDRRPRGSGWEDPRARRGRSGAPPSTPCRSRAARPGRPAPAGCRAGRPPSRPRPRSRTAW